MSVSHQIVDLLVGYCQHLNVFIIYLAWVASLSDMPYESETSIFCQPQMLYTTTQSNQAQVSRRACFPQFTRNALPADPSYINVCIYINIYIFLHFNNHFRTRKYWISVRLFDRIRSRTYSHTAKRGQSGWQKLCWLYTKANVVMMMHANII